MTEVFLCVETQEMLVGLAQNDHQLSIATRETHLGLCRITIEKLTSLKETQEMLVGLAQNGHQLFIATREMHSGLRRIAMGMLPSREEGFRRCLCEGLRRDVSFYLI